MDCFNRNKRKGAPQVHTERNGYSLIELLITLAILGILIAVGVPNYRSFTANSGMEALKKDIESYFGRALGESKKQRKRVVVCARASDVTCGTDWAKGLLLFIDENDTGVRYSLDAGEEIIRVLGESKVSNIQVKAIASRGLPPSTVETDRLSIEPRVLSDSAAFIICDNRGVDYALSFSLLSSGLTNDSLAKDDQGNSIDPWGVPINCD